jgi:hypothetical protein
MVFQRCWGIHLKRPKYNENGKLSWKLEHILKTFYKCAITSTASEEYLGNIQRRDTANKA